MHKHEHDTKPQKAINLRGKKNEVIFFSINNPFDISIGAKVLVYEDQKHGPSLELTWSNRYNNPKHYHVN